MQDPKNSQARKPWYQKAMEMATLWKAFSNPSDKIPSPLPNATIWKTISKTAHVSSTTNSNKHKLKKCTSLRVATSFSRVCLCAPISSYTELFQADHHHHVPPRRSFSYPPARSSSSSSKLPPLPTPQDQRTPSARISLEGRKIFRGKSLTDDVLMRRFVIEEEAMIMQVRRRNQMEIIRKRSAIRRRKLGPSPLSRMVLAQQELISS